MWWKNMADPSKDVSRIRNPREHREIMRNGYIENVDSRKLKKDPIACHLEFLCNNAIMLVQIVSSIEKDTNKSLGSDFLTNDVFLCLEIAGDEIQSIINQGKIANVPFRTAWNVLYVFIKTAESHSSHNPVRHVVYLIAATIITILKIYYSDLSPLDSSLPADFFEWCSELSPPLLSKESVSTIDLDSCNKHLLSASNGSLPVDH